MTGVGGVKLVTGACDRGNVAVVAGSGEVGGVKLVTGARRPDT